MKAPIAIFLWLVLFPACACLGGEDFRIVERGFAELRGQGADAAFARWLVNSPPGTGKASLGVLRELETRYGRCRSHQVLEIVPVGAQSSLVYVAARFDKGAVFFRFIVHQRLTQEVINGIELSADPVDVFPEKLLVLCR